MSAETSASQIAFNLLQKARNKFEAKKYDTALQYCQAALAIYQEIGDSTGVAYTLTNIGNIYRRQAVESYQEALSTFRENSIKISEEIAESINSPLETQLDWYGSNNGNTEILKPTDFRSYIGDGQASRRGDGMGDRGASRGGNEMGDGEASSSDDGSPSPGGDGEASSSDGSVNTNGEGQR
ncbi:MULTISPECIES: tetratricopeptide repeat protein [unclassified Microcoleus]|uniref:tetratricopeptide repeat protein n=1 Tax=unclassified Microcoleus TaxID=2642155 RepID=UPI002FD66D2E